MSVPPDPSSPEERSRRRREQILKTAMDVATDHGLAGLTRQAVVTTADVDPSAIDYYFGDLTNLVVETIRELRFQRHERYGRMLASLPPVGSTFADWNASARDVARGLVWVCGSGPYTIWDLLSEAVRYPGLLVEAGNSLDALQESVGQLMVASGVPRGELLGRPLVALEAGLIAQHRALGGSEEELIDDLSHGLLSMINGHRALVTGAIPGA